MWLRAGRLLLNFPGWMRVHLWLRFHVKTKYCSGQFLRSQHSLTMLRVAGKLLLISHEHAVVFLSYSTSLAYVSRPYSLRGSIRIKHQTNCLAVRMILPAWFDHLEERFSYKKFVSKKFCVPMEKLVITFFQMVKPSSQNHPHSCSICLVFGF